MLELSKQILIYIFFIKKSKKSKLIKQTKFMNIKALDSVYIDTQVRVYTKLKKIIIYIKNKIERFLNI